MYSFLTVVLFPSQEEDSSQSNYLTYFTGVCKKDK